MGRRSSATRAATSWNTPRVLTFAQFCGTHARRSNGRARNLPDRLLPPGAEWACLRELRRDAGGTAEARALLNSRAHAADWRIPRAPRALGVVARSRLLRRARSTRSTRLARRAGSQAAARTGSMSCDADRQKLLAAGVGPPAGARTRDAAPARRDADAPASPRRSRACRDRDRARTTSTSSSSSRAGAAQQLERDPRLPAAHRRREAAAAARTLRTPAVADADAVGVDRARAARPRRRCSRSKAAGRSRNFRSSRTRC